MLQLLGILLQADGAVNEPSRSFTVSGEGPYQGFFLDERA